MNNVAQEKAGVIFQDFPIELVSVDDLKPHPQNYREHPEEQLQHIIESIKANGFYRPIVAAQDLTILAGHGVHKAAQRMGLSPIPVRRLPLAPLSARALKILAGDNEIARLGEVNDVALADILRQIREEDALGLLGTGYDEEAFTQLVLGTKPLEEEPTVRYTSKIEVPTYQPANMKPRVSDLYDSEKAQRLAQRIEAQPGLTEEERQFLLLAAHRHTVLHFNRIADFYAHASPEVQELMEESALVIIDFDRAIELGYVEVTQRIAAIVAEEYGEEDNGDIE